ncbi:MAG: alpha/beta fold hydrolase [Sphingomonadales bacterium]|nr:alpha/beta fold hydrolase [Sphingomonadales bacterium]
MAESRTIVLIPGLMCDGAVWAGQVGRLSRLGPLFVACNDGLDSLPAMASRILAQTHGRLDLVGHSMGGRIALEVAAQAPGRVSSLALLSSGAHGPKPHERAERMALVRLGHGEGMAAVVRAWLPGMIPPDADARVVAAIEAMLLRATPETLARQQASLLDRRDRIEFLRRLDCPVLYATGALDRWSPPGQHGDMARQTAGARLEIIPAAGHMLPMEAAAATAELLAAFLANPA